MSSENKKKNKLKLIVKARFRLKKIFRCSVFYGKHLCLFIKQHHKQLTFLISSLRFLLPGEYEYLALISALDQKEIAIVIQEAFHLLIKLIKWITDQNRKDK